MQSRKGPFPAYPEVSACPQYQRTTKAPWLGQCSSSPARSPHDQPQPAGSALQLLNPQFQAFVFFTISREPAPRPLGFAVSSTGPVPSTVTGIITLGFQWNGTPKVFIQCSYCFSSFTHSLVPSASFKSCDSVILFIPHSIPVLGSEPGSGEHKSSGSPHQPFS